MSAYNVRPPVLVPRSAERFALFRGEPITIAGYGAGADALQAEFCPPKTAP
ncbi:hypothetical protein ACH4YO_37660 [Streptomyces noursei]|uniref:hypothetical protein n=1 Tax=Streptomyces noursei TaxID=1971 RepID=UPI00340B85BF